MTLNRLLISLCLAGGLYAQTTAATGTFSGKVTAPDGSVVPYATVTVTDASGRARNAMSGTDGLFSVANVPEGTYRVDIAVPGYQKLTQTGIQVTDGSPLNIKFGLQREVPKSGVSRFFHRKSPTDSSSGKK
ncbi:MAG: carboxypeptidase-like regulatory domain-containing protein [Acidobacteriota bacterium]|nr:carboxypeptidase-like regulatory domain-containing protein [Acidobacteriota bacterium]